MFQHTAARRRLTPLRLPLASIKVSTHSRPKAAERKYVLNTYAMLFQHTAARRRLGLPARL